MDATPSAPTERPAPVPRRRVLALAGGGVASATLALFGGQRPALATHDPLATDTQALHVGEENGGTGSPTVLSDSMEHQEAFPHGAVLAVVNTAPTDEGAAIAIAFAGGLMGTGGLQVDGVDSRAIGTESMPIARFAVFGANEGFDPSGSGIGVLGHCTDQDPEHGVAGVVGESVLLIERGEEGLPPSNGIGVIGRSETGIGVVGESRSQESAALFSGTGVIGRSGSGIGVEASSESGFGLKVLGKAGFSAVGGGVVVAGQSSVTVTDPLATTASHITVTLTSDPGVRHVRWVSRAEGGFTLHLTDAPPNKRPQTSFTYLIVEPVT